MTNEQIQAILDDPAGFMAKAGTTQKDPPDLGTREEQLKAMRDHIEHVGKMRPEFANQMDGKGEWYIPVVDWNVEMRKQLSDQEYKALSDVMAKPLRALFDPQAFEDIKPEVYKLLEGHDDLKRRYDEIFGDLEPMKKVHEYLVESSKKKTGETAEALPVPVVD